MRRWILRGIAASALSLAAGAALADEPTQVQELVVTAQAADRSSQAAKTDTPLIEIPQSITVVTRQEMDVIGAETMPQAVRYAAGVQPAAYGLDSRSDDVTIRGFDAGSFTSNQFFDGLRSQPGGQWTLLQYDAYNLERIEILKGPSAVLYGAVAPGGLVNMVTKRPQEAAAGEVSLQASSHDQYRGTFDVTGPVTADGKLAYRAVGMYRDGGSDVDHVDLGRWFLAPSLTWKPTLDTSITVIAHYQEDFGGSTFQFIPDVGTYFPNPEGELHRSDFLGEPNFNTFDRQQFAIGYAAVQRLSDSWQLRQNFRYTNISSVFEAAVMDILLPDNRTMTRRAVRGDGESESFAVDTQSELRFTTGAVTHTLLTGVDYFRTDYEHMRRGGYDTSTPPVPSIDIFDRIYAGGIDTSGFETQFHDRAWATQLGFYTQDQLAVGGLRVMLGVRHDIFDSETDDLAYGGQTTVDDAATTWRAGVTYLFDNGLAPYASCSESFEPVAGSDYTGAPFVPTTGQQYEAGLKYQLPQGAGFITVSAYDLRQQNLRTRAPSCGADPFCSDEVQIGEVRIRGLELEGQLNPAPGFTAIGSVTYMDSELTSDNWGNQGNRKEQTPTWQANAYLDYTIQSGPLAGLALGGGVRHIGESYGDADNVYLMDGYTLFDAGLRYDLGQLNGQLKGLKLAVNASNLANKEYLAYCSYGSCAFGAGRSVQVNLAYRW